MTIICLMVKENSYGKFDNYWPTLLLSRDIYILIFFDSKPGKQLIIISCYNYKIVAIFISYINIAIYIIIYIISCYIY